MTKAKAYKNNINGNYLMLHVLITGAGKQLPPVYFSLSELSVFLPGQQGYP